MERGGHTSGLSPTEARNGTDIFHILTNSWLVLPPHPRLGVSLPLDALLTLSKQPLGLAPLREPLLTPPGVLRDWCHFGTFWGVSTEAIEGAGASLARRGEGLAGAGGGLGAVLGSWGHADGTHGGGHWQG